MILIITKVVWQVKQKKTQNLTKPISALRKDNVKAPKLILINLLYIAGKYNIYQL